MPPVKLLAQTPEGAPGDVRNVSRARASDLVNAGLAQRVAEEQAKPRRRRR